MKRNIVLFGPAEAGKSTLGGYLVTEFNSNCNFEKFEKFDLKKKIDLASDYRADSRLAYIFDTSIDEQKRMYFIKGGTSKYVKTRGIRINDLEALIIDTPGHKDWYRQRLKGMYYGDIGVFIIELKKVNKSLYNPESQATVIEFLSPLLLWKNFKTDERKPVIVISKMDLGDYSENEYRKALEIIRALCEDESIEAIPISISVNELKSNNISAKSEKMQWYQGPTLSEKLIQISDDLPSSKIDEPLFISIAKKGKIHGIGNVLRGKVLQGSLKINSYVRIMPAKCGDKFSANCLAKVRNIVKDNYGPIKIAEKGEIIGIDIQDIRIDGKRCNKRNLDILHTSCIIDKDAHCLSGNIHQLSVPFKEIDKFHLLGSVQILWFGRFVHSQVVHINDTGLITLELDNLAFLPTNDYFKFHCENIMLKINEDYVKATREKMGTPYKLTLLLSNLELQNETFINYFRDIEYETVDTGMIFYCEGKYKHIIEKIKDVYMRLEKSLNPSNMEIEIKEVAISFSAHHDDEF